MHAAAEFLDLQLEQLDRSEQLLDRFVLAG
jgi:hypothetical protein